MRNLAEELRKSVSLAPEDEANEYFRMSQEREPFKNWSPQPESDFRWGETLMGEDSPTGKPIVYVNQQKFEKGLGREVTPEMREKYFTSESIHNLKNVDENLYNNLLNSALKNPEYQKWMEDSYKYSQEDYGENRPIEDWHKDSRFDQVIGGYLYAGDEDFPTMTDWTRDMPGFSGDFLDELENLRQQMGY